MDTNALRDELAKPAYSGLTDDEILSVLNDTDSIEYYEQPATADLTNFLFNSGLYAKLLANYRDHPNLQIRVAAESALDLAASQIANVNLQNANTQMMLSALVQGGVWTQAEADSVMAFARRSRSRADELGGTVAQTDLNAARNSEAATQLESAVNTAHGAVLAVVQTARRGESATVPTAAQLVQMFEQTLTGAV